MHVYVPWSLRLRKFEVFIKEKNPNINIAIVIKVSAMETIVCLEVFSTVVNFKLLALNIFHCMQHLRICCFQDIEVPFNALSWMDQNTELFTTKEVMW